MKKKLALAIMLSAAGSAFIFGAGAPSILSPRPPAPAARARAERPVAGEVLEVRGKIIKVVAADKARKRAEWIVLLVGKRRLSVVVYEGTSIRDGKGSRIKVSLLKAGETVDLSYRQKGKARTALAIRA
jgi:hypothetical protein